MLSLKAKRSPASGLRTIRPDSYGINHASPAFLRIFAAMAVMTLSIICAPGSGIAALERIPVHTLSISFDLDKQLLFGTSKIELPPHTPLQIDCNGLHVTGALMESQGGSYRLLIPLEDGFSYSLSDSAAAQVVKISWRLDLSKGRTPDNLINLAGITLAGHWHPRSDIKMIHRLEAALPDNFIGICEAEAIKSINKGGLRYFQASFPHPLYQLHFLAAPYVVKSKRMVDGPEVATYFFPEDSELADDYLSRTLDYIERYRKLLGPFPYARFSVVENQLPTGYGLPTFTLLGRAVIRLPFIKDTSLGHEVLHSWFGNSIDLKEGSGNWLEGLTTYLSDHLYKEDQGEGAEYRKNQLLRYQAFVGDDNKFTLSDFQNVGHTDPGAEGVRTVGYDKGSMFFHMLKQELGEDVFFAGLRRLAAEKQHTAVGWDDLRELFSSTAGRDLSAFFTQWLDRPDVPSLSIKEATVNQRAGQSHISLRLEQGTKEKYGDITIPVLVETITGPVKKSIRLRATDTVYTVSVDSLPLTMTLDPDYDLMRSMSLPEFAPTWSRFGGASAKKALLGREEDRDLYQPLIDYLSSIGCPVLLADEVKNSELAKGSFLFLGPSTHSRAIFAGPTRNEQGFSLDVRNNPFDPRRVMVLAAAENRDELMAAVHKIRHYGRYGYLRFKGGKNIAKEVLPSQNGMRVELMELPTAVPVNRLTDFQSVIEEIKGSRVIYLGENHTDYGNHILQLQVIQALHAKGLKLAVGMEMFPRSSQAALDDYIGGVVADEKEFLARSRYFAVWGYDYRLYRDIIEFAKKYSIPLIGLNLDKQIVSQAFRTGNLDELSDEQRKDLPADRDLDLPGYRERLEAIHSFHDTMGKSEDSFNGFLQAQALWDETMGETIADYVTTHSDTIMVVLVGGGHVYKADAIPPRVARRISVEQRVLVGMDSLEPDHNRENFADYILRMPYGELPPAAKIGVSLVEEKSDDEGGTKVKVVGISPHGKAGKAGVEKEDYIVEVDGTRITTVGELKSCLLDKKVGDFATLTIERGDELLHIKAELSSLESFGPMMPPSHPRVKK